MRIIPYGHQDIDESDVVAVVEALRSDWLTQGPTITRFEQALADYCGARHAVAFCNATAALHLAYLVLDLGPGDLLWTSPNTFVATANAARFCGAEVDFVDIDPRTYCMSTEALAEKLNQAEKGGRFPKVVVPVHFAGQSCEMEKIRALSDRYGFRIVEDAAHAVGARYRGEPVGNCRYSDIAVFSFHPVKIITTGEGGAALTNNTSLAERMTRLRSHGITRDCGQMGGNHDAWYYEQIELGFNYRLTDLQAALGMSQLKRLDRYVARRHELASRYNELLVALPVTFPWQHPDNYSAFHLYPVRVSAERRSAVFGSLRRAGIGVQVHYIPVHTQPYYRSMGFKAGDFPETERYYAEAITLPLFPAMTEAEQDIVCNALTSALA